VKGDGGYDDDRYCNHCRSKQRVHIVVVSRWVVELTCHACKSNYQLPRYPCVS
jgi:hypothetical protein